MIVLNNVSKKYSKGKEALTNIQLEIPKGQIIGLFGENGAGKTTLLKSILQLQSYEGSITLDDEKITSKNISKLSFATCEHSFFANISASEHRHFYEVQFPKFRKKRFDSLMNFFELEMNTKIKHFSTGQKNQFEVILALSQGADYILMDEPFAGNDVFNREDFYKVLLGILDDNETIILSTHLLEEVDKFIDRAILLNKGNIIGDCLIEDLDQSLINYVKEEYRYQKNRVANSIEMMNEDSDDE